MRRFIVVILVLIGLLARGVAPARAADELLPKYVNPATQKAIKNGLDYLAKSQSDEGNWSSGQDGTAYPVTMAALGGMAFLANGNTPSRGPYADNMRRVVNYLITQGRPNGLITSAEPGIRHADARPRFCPDVHGPVLRDGDRRAKPGVDEEDRAGGHRSNCPRRKAITADGPTSPAEATKDRSPSRRSRAFARPRTRASPCPRGRSKRR